MHKPRARHKVDSEPRPLSHQGVFAVGDSQRVVVRRLLFAAGSLVGVGFAGAAGYLVIGDGRWSYGECLYMTLITLSTVGYGEVLEGMQQMAAARMWTVLLILLGSGSLVFFVSSLTAFIVEGDVRGVLRTRRMQKSIDALRDHVILVGLGATGIHVANELHAINASFVVIDVDGARLEAVARESLPGLLYVHGDATLDHVLEQAGIARAKSLAATLADDKDNVFVTITARALKPELRIVSKMIADSTGTKLRRAGANSTVSPHHIGGMRVVSELIRPSVVEFLDTMLHERSSTMRVEEVAIPASSSLVGMRLDQSQIRERTRALLLATHDETGAYTYNPEGSFLLTRGMKLLVLGELTEITKLRQSLGASILPPPMA